MASFERQETVILEQVVTDSKTGALKNPATSMVVTVTDPLDAVVVAAQAMANDSVGNYHYDYTLGAGAVLGVYQVLYTATDGSRVTKGWDSFEVHA